MNDSKDVIALQTWWKSCLIRISSDAECWITKGGEVGMRLIDADVLENQLEEAISLQGIMALALGTDDESIQAEMKAYRDILNGVREQETIPYDMKWNPNCEDCLPDGIDDCIECHKRQEGEPDHG